MAATITAVDRDPGAGSPKPGVGSPASVIRLATRSFARDERADLFETPGVEHVLRLDPAATRGADTEPHLACQPFGAVAVAVDGDGDTRRCGAACDGAVHVEVSWRAVDFHRRSGLHGCLKQRVKVQIEAGGACR